MLHPWMKAWVYHASSLAEGLLLHAFSAEEGFPWNASSRDENMLQRAFS